MLHTLPLGSNGQKTVFPTDPLFQMGAEKFDLTKRKSSSVVGAHFDPFIGLHQLEVYDISFCQPVTVSPPFPDVPAWPGHRTPGFAHR